MTDSALEVSNRGSLDEPLQVPLNRAAMLLGVCRQTLYRMRDDNEIAFGRLRGRAMVPMAEVRRVHAQLYPDATQNAVGGPVVVPKKCRPKKVKLFPMVS
jgi:hypothetical protein